MSGLSNVDSIAEGFSGTAGTIALEVGGMALNDGKFTFDLENARSHQDQIENASRVVITSKDSGFYKDPGSCPSVEISANELSLESYNIFSGTAKIGVSGLAAEQLDQVLVQGCAVADIKNGNQPQETTFTAANYSPGG
jgi:hypothetical protein